MFESFHGMTAVWVVLMIGFLVVEGIAPGLVSIWFALGALAALISALLGAQVWLQAVWFVVVSLLALVITRPLAKKYVNSRTQATNADMLIGQECIVTETRRQGVDGAHRRSGEDHRKGLRRRRRAYRGRQTDRQNKSINRRN